MLALGQLVFCDFCKRLQQDPRNWLNFNRMESSKIHLNQPAAHLMVSGPDAADFLQGQFTQDLGPLDRHSAAYGLWLNHKGKVLADSYIFREEAEVFRVVSAHSPAKEVQERLEAYIIADDVEVRDAGPGSLLAAVSGAGGSAVLEAMGLSAPEPGRCVREGGCLVFRGRQAGREASWHVLADAETSAAILDRLTAEADRLGERAASADELSASRIASGVPLVPHDIGPEDLPNEGGLEHEAVSFTKGCYLGQEVMARLHNLGQVRRRLHIVRVAADEKMLPAHTPLFAGEKQVGDLRSCARDGAALVALAMLQTHSVRVGDRLAIASDSEPVVEVVAVAEGRAW